MKLTQKWLKSKSVCSEGLQWFTEQSETDGVRVLEKLLTEKHLSWANWLVVRLMKHNQQIRYAIFAAEQVIGLFEKKYPKDDKPRKGIEAAKAYLAKPSKATKSAAYAAYVAANAAANVANVAAYAAYAAANAAMKEKIIRYGVQLLKEVASEESKRKGIL